MGHNLGHFLLFAICSHQKVFTTLHLAVVDDMHASVLQVVQREPSCFIFWSSGGADVMHCLVNYSLLAVLWLLDDRMNWGIAHSSLLSCNTRRGLFRIFFLSVLPREMIYCWITLISFLHFHKLQLKTFKIKLTLLLLYCSSYNLLGQFQMYIYFHVHW